LLSLAFYLVFIIIIVDHNGWYVHTGRRVFT